MNKATKENKKLLQNWDKIDWKVWLEDFKQISLIRLLIFCLVFYCSYEILEPYYFKSFLNDIFFKFKLDWPIKATVVVVFLILLVSGIRKIKSGFIPRPSRLVSLTLFLSIYIYKWRWNGLYEFDTVFGNSLVWFDFVPLSIVVLLLDFRAYFKPFDIEDESKALIYELKDEENNEVRDLYHRDNFAETVAELISSSSNSKESTVIGIFSEWGSGKTDFLKRLKSRLNKGCESENIVREFNPWRSSSGNDITEAFFSFLQGELKQYDSSINSHLKNYMNEVLGSSKAVSVRFIHSMMNKFLDSNGDKSAKKQIQESLKLTGKRFIIYVDDIDRLTGREIMEVFKLVRVIADFPNVFFVVTMDYEYVIKTVKKTNEIDNIEQFIKKIFNVYYRLPIVKKETIISQLIALIGKEKGIKDELRIKFKQILNQINERNDFTGINDSETLVNVKDLLGLVERMLLNSRDVLQFYNSIKCHLVNLNEEVDLTDLILLELLKVYSFSTYNSLSIQDESLLEIENGLYCKIKKENIDPITVQVLEQLIATNDKSIAKFCDVINHYLYFSYTLPENMISRKDFHDSLERTDESFLDIVETWTKTKKKDLFFLMSKHSFVQEIGEYKKFLKAYLRFGKELGFNRLPREVVDIKKYLDLLKIPSPEQKELVSSILNNEEFLINERITFCEHLGRQFRGDENRIFHDKEILLIITRNIFKEALDRPDGLDLYELLLKIDGTPENMERFHLEPICASLYKEFLSENCKELSKYLKVVFRPIRPSPRDTLFTLDPFIMGIFGDLNILRGFLKSCDFSDRITNKLKEVFLNFTLEDFEPQEIVLSSKDDNYKFVYDYFWAKERNEDPEG